MPNIDIGRWPQKVRIEWSRKLVDDRHADKPDEMDEGFWPSLDRKAAGWIGSDDRAEFDRQMAAATERMREYERGDWGFVGVIAAATVYIPIGGNSFRIMELESAGLWGVESDAGDYLDSIFEDEKAGLLDELKTLCSAVNADDTVHA